MLRPRFGVIEPAPCRRTQALAKAKTKTAVKAKAVKAPARKAPAKTAVAKPAARKVVKPTKVAAPKKEAPRKVAKVPPVVAAVGAKPAPTASNGGAAKAAAPVAPRAPIAATVAKATLLKVKDTAPKPADAPKVAPAAQPHRTVTTTSGAQPRADIPPVAGFSLMVDGHFKNQFETLKNAKDAANELRARFPVLRLEIYDAVKKARLAV
jgi:hypothetical protein